MYYLVYFGQFEWYSENMENSWPFMAVIIAYGQMMANSIYCKNLFALVFLYSIHFSICLYVVVIGD